jgi:hypothetical protein
MKTKVADEVYRKLDEETCNSILLFEHITGLVNLIEKEIDITKAKLEVLSLLNGIKTIATNGMELSTKFNDYLTEEVFQ